MMYHHDATVRGDSQKLADVGLKKEEHSTNAAFKNAFPVFPLRNRDLEHRRHSEITQHCDTQPDMYRTLFDLAPMGYFRLDLDGMIREANLAGASMLGMRRDDLRNLPFLNFIAWGDRPDYTDFIASIKPDTKRHIELRLLKDYEPYAWIYLEGIVAPDGSAGSGELRLVATDITDRKKNEQKLLQDVRMACTATLAANIAHCLNNRMATVLGYADLLMSEIGPDAKPQQMVSNIAQAAQKVGELTQLLVAYACKGQSRPQAVNLNDLIRDVTESEKEQKNGRIIVDMDLADGLWPLHADVQHMRMVVENLFVNAIESIDRDGTITFITRNIDLGTGRSEHVSKIAPGSYVCLMLNDTGCGIPPKVLKRMFEPFFSTKFMGRGMGLAAVHSVVSSHQGHIEVKSQSGSGTQISIYLPAVKI